MLSLAACEVWPVLGVDGYAAMVKFRPSVFEQICRDDLVVRLQRSNFLSGSRVELVHFHKPCFPLGIFWGEKLMERVCRHRCLQLIAANNSTLDRHFVDYLEIGAVRVT